MGQCKIWDPAFALSTEADFKKAQPAKTLCVPYYACLFFNKIRDKSRKRPAWN
jgi:hypothetical protein